MTARSEHTSGRQFTLRSFLILTVTLGVGAGFIGRWLVWENEKWQIRTKTQALTAAGAMVYCAPNGKVFRVEFQERFSQTVNNNVLRHLLEFDDSLEQLDLSQTVVTDAALPTLAKLTRLRQIDLAGTKITNQGGSCPNCDVCDL